MLAFDGINEIPSSRRAKGAERDLAIFIKLYSKNKIIITTRSVGYDLKAFDSWPIFEILPLDRESILDFTRNYLGDELGRQLFQKIGGEDVLQWQKPHSLITLARNPLHLWMLTETYSQLKNLSPDKSVLVKSFTEFILQAREQGKASYYSFLVKNRLLCVLAFEMFESGEIVRTSQKKTIEIFSKVSGELKNQSLLEPHVTALNLLDEIRLNGLLYLENGNGVRWAHQLFQEFFGAMELVYRFESGIPIWKQLNNADWKESTIMAASLTYKPEQYVNEVMNGWRGWIGLIYFENPRALLAINCVNETHLWNDEELKKKIIPIAQTRISRGVNQKFMQIGGAIVNYLGRPFSSLLLYLAAMQFESYYILGPILWSLGEMRISKATPILLTKLKNQNRTIRWVAADALRKLQMSSAIDGLIEALGDYDGDVRWVVIQALINVGDTTASSALVTLLNHPDPATRWAVSFALGKIGTTAHLIDLEVIRKTDHTPVWWGETVSQAADNAIKEIQERHIQQGQNLSSVTGDMTKRIYQ